MDETEEERDKQYNVTRQKIFEWFNEISTKPEIDDQ